MTTHITRTGVDVTVAADYPSTNYNSAKTLSVRNNPKDNYAFIWLSNPVPRTAKVLSAKLYLYSKGAWASGSVRLDLQRIATNWKAASVTWNNRPATTGTVTSVTQASPADATEWAFDVTSILNTVSTGGGTYYGFRISTADGDSVRRDFYSLQQGGVRAPRLEVTWSDAPSAPHTLSPSSGNAVSIAKPVLNFDFHDVSGSMRQQACQVQIDAGNHFTAPGWDSGTVVTSESELDLSATGYPGLANGAATYWRVRVQDGAGLWSPWSVSASFKRISKGTLTLNNPADAAAPFVSEHTPPIIWTFGGAGRSQRHWRVRLADNDRPSKYLVDTGVRSGTDNEYTLPAGKLTQVNTYYRVILDVWDDADREGTSGDPVAYTVVRVFKFAEDPTPDPPAWVHVDFDRLGKPYAYLTWSRATAPDLFNVYRDGVLVNRTPLDPADYNVAGSSTTYHYTDKDAAPNVSHDWAVRALVKDTGSAYKSSAGRYVTGTMRLSVVWLVDVDSDQLCPILDVTLDLSMPDVATAYEPVGAETVIRVVQAQRGPQGTITGRLAPFADLSAGDCERTMYWFKDRPTNEVRLTVGTKNYHVILGNVSVAPLPGRTGDRSVSFDWWSMDGAP